MRHYRCMPMTTMLIMFQYRNRVSPPMRLQIGKGLGSPEVVFQYRKRVSPHAASVL